MKLLSEELVERTRHEISLYSEDHSIREIKKLGKNQPHLFSFIAEFTQGLGDHAIELCIGMFFAVYNMFQKGHRKKIEQVSEEEIIECYEDNESLFKSMEMAHEKFYERRAKVMVSAQPYVMKYVLETLYETPEEEYISNEHKEDFGYLYLLIKTVIDVLDKKTG
jgi:hypothetical protein